MGSRNGKFSVRSAYRLAQTTQEGGGQATSSEQSVARKIWRGIWSMNVPNKVKHFTWKVCRNILATKENLWKRKVTQEGLCEECGNMIESTTHLLWFCKQALAVWSHIVDRLLKWRDAFPDLMERVMMICWGIWRNRNEAKHGGKRKTEEFQVANEVRSKQEAQIREVVRWTGPKQGQYKVNCDAAVFTKSREVGFGVIIRDCAGLDVAALSKKRIGLTGAVKAEAKAMEVFVQFAKDVGIREATFEVKGIGDIPSSIQNIFYDIIQDLQTFRAAEVSHVKRQENALAHLLAQHALHVVDYNAWLDECPSFIEHTCAHDVIRFSTI
ncbi:putative ribonuclease h protein [Quercus suber]|uniref:Ribonuclease h protein n=1 Tax=Quercus suber TaxID=58331 RepID=A0AAW0JZ37_QUESU